MSDKSKLMTWEEAVEWVRNQPDKKDIVKSCYYDDPVEDAAQRFEGSEEWAAVKALLADKLPGDVLDIGAGRGISSYAFAKSGCAVTALEPNSSKLVGAGAIQLIAERTQVQIKVVQEYGETLPFPENSFDVVYARAVLHHAQDMNKLCMEVSRVLRPGGALIFTREHVISRREDLPKFFNDHLLHHLYGGENAYLLSDYIGAIKGSGLRLSSILGPHESVVNYAPINQQELKQAIASRLGRLIGNSLANYLVGTKSVFHLIGWILSKFSNLPGRLYTFMARK
jgi:SAM-dependent methyltransferase